MAITPSGPSGHPTAIRAEALGERFGRALARARHRIKTAGRPEESEAGRRSEGNVAPGRLATESPRMHRADELLTRFERGFVSYATVMRDRLRRAAARIREEAEDVAAEAAHVRETRAAAEPQGNQSNRERGEPAA